MIWCLARADRNYFEIVEVIRIVVRNIIFSL